MRKEKKTKRRILSDVLIVLAAAVFLFSGYRLYQIFSEYRKGENEYDRIRESAVLEKEAGDGEETPGFSVDFDQLKKINPDVKAWLRFDEPSRISYPVVRGEDNDAYLHTTFEGRKNAVGTLFMDCKNGADFTDRNTFIYGHNMKDGSMFGQLRKYRDPAFCEQYPYFYVYTPDGGEAVYRIFAVSIVRDTSDIYRMGYEDDGAFADYIETVGKDALYFADGAVGADDGIVSLSTCTNRTDDERLVVQGVRVSEKADEKNVGGIEKKP